MKLDAAHIRFTPSNGNPVGGPWQVHPLPFEGHSDTAVITLGEQGLGGSWEIEPAPFIVTSDPTPPVTFVTVYDSTTVRTIGRIGSSSEESIAAYDDGAFDNIQEAKLLYPNHHIVSIAVRGGSKAEYADTEPGNMTSLQALHGFKVGLITVGIYADRHRWDTELIPLLHSREFSTMPKMPKRWVADWTGQPHLPVLSDGVMADACQWDNHVIGRVNTDVSLFKSNAL